ncbi:hypothetical protein N7520_006771 [Penicillium odoratum]|uniref:uncharacterized protein n=1 Tax=Penicillium odoratum TaxID=1167516 RepID=UPI0025484ED0|nr:uncharacterized protein N7520_006771 [Penicillium odoratum]KAJ5759615.1 hypothetical protein N7520_006771 [Penicillium odoratum]
MTDCIDQLQPVTGDFGLTLTDREFVLCLLNSPSLSLTSTESRQTSACGEYFSSEPQPAKVETPTNPKTPTKKRNHLPQISFGDYARDLEPNQELSSGNNHSLSPDSISESSPLPFQVFDLLEVPLSPKSNLSLPSPATPPTSSVYYSEETDSCRAESPTPGGQGHLAASLRARRQGRLFALSYEQLIDSSSFHLDQDNIVPRLIQPLDSWDNRRPLWENNTPIHIRSSDIEGHISSPSIPTISISNSTSPPLKSHPASKSTEDHSQPRKRFASKFKNRLSTIFGDRPKVAPQSRRSSSAFCFL